MDIHRPKVPHSWRELAKEIAIIVIGVLIALSAEQLVETLQWHQKVRVAEEAVRGELLFDDGPEMYQRVAMHPCLVTRLDSIRAAVEGGAARQDIARLIAGYWLEYRTFDHLALDAVVAAEVAPHMPQQELAAISNVYSVMPLLDRTSGEEAGDLAKLRAFRSFGGGISDEEKDRVLAAVEALRKDDQIISMKSGDKIPVLRRIGQLNHGQTQLLVANARKHYGECVKAP